VSFDVDLMVSLQGEKGQWFSNPLQERAPVRSDAVIGKYLKK